MAVGNWAIVRETDGYVENTVVWEGPDSNSGWFPPEGTFMVEYFPENVAAPGYWYKDGLFSPPPEQAPPPPTDAEISASNSATLLRQNQLAAQQKSALTNRIGTLQDAIDNIGVEGMEDYAATPAEQAEFAKRKTQLTQWKNYAIALGRVTSQTGWALKVTWPTQPKDGMDLSISPTSATASASTA